MTRYLADSTDLTAIANAIRTKGGTSSPLVFPGGFSDAISAIQGLVEGVAWMQPLAEDVQYGHVSGGKWVTETTPGDYYSDIYLLTPGHFYIFAYGSTKGNKRDGAKFDIDVSTLDPATVSEYSGSQYSMGNNDPYRPVVITILANSTQPYFVITKTNQGVSGIKTYVCDVTNAIDHPNANKITDAYYLFYFRHRLDKQQELFDLMENVENFGYCWAYCVYNSGDAQIDISACDLSHAKILTYALANNAYQTSFVLPASLKQAKPTKMDYMFYYCQRLTSISGLTDLDLSCITDMSYMFQTCSALQTVDVSRWDFGNVTNLKAIFANMSALTTIIGLDTWVVNPLDMNSLFSFCTALTEIDISTWTCTIAGNTALNNFARGDTALQRVAIGHILNNHANINTAMMFYQCAALAELVILDDSTVMPLGNNMFGSATLMNNGTGVIYVPDALLTDYQTATNWTTYASQIKGLSQHPNPWWASAQ